MALKRLGKSKKKATENKDLFLDPEDSKTLKERAEKAKPMKLSKAAHQAKGGKALAEILDDEPSDGEEIADFRPHKPSTATTSTATSMLSAMISASEQRREQIRENKLDVKEADEADKFESAAYRAAKKADGAPAQDGADV
ncbi:hypothetical protein J8273_2529 [Carpediemonas membranifera]|uniref:Uncharacterized protein n=1 Tax=Carpediemonas membranifera TaxID=201153 RepID=A0A8J6BF59_9EUKA|nr:hypothetical protein J8273_2529 [Carpediemonas membranifera]|eukprot:KAG9396177.1 hypothetical protein J8273_2529 [Carpediemonas membranifera]